MNVLLTKAIDIDKLVYSEYKVDFTIRRPIVRGRTQRRTLAP